MMKNIIAALILAAISFAGCKKDPDPVVADEPENAMTFTTAMEGEAEFIMAGTGEAVIDWGDGTTPDTVTLYEHGYNAGAHRIYSHTFSGATLRTIVIKGYVTHLTCRNMQLTAIDVTKNTELVELECVGNRLTGLDVTKNTKLGWFNCSNNELTSLDVSKNTALSLLNCRANRLTAEALNALFGTLHANAGYKEIYIEANPGTATCDLSIAIAKKGWYVGINWK